MFLIVGLGNIGAEYTKTRHNIGFMMADSLVYTYGNSAGRHRFHSEFFEMTIEGHKVFVMKPATFMNRSGIAAGEAVSFFKIPLSNVLVFHDDLDLPEASIRMKCGGGHGGHNGLKSLDAHIGKDYWRVRMGIGHPGDKNLVTPWVLGSFKNADFDWIDKNNRDICFALPLFLDGKIDAFRAELGKV